MGAAEVLHVASLVCIGRSAEGLADIDRPGIELAAWQRGPDPAWAGWLAALPADAVPACRLEVAPDDAVHSLNAHFDVCGIPCGQPRDAFVADIASLVTRFAALARTHTVRLRLDAITGDACRRWHRDCVRLRLICTYRGPGTQWVPPAWGAAVMARPDDRVLGVRPRPLHAPSPHQPFPRRARRLSCASPPTPTEQRPRSGPAQASAVNDVDSAV